MKIKLLLRQDTYDYDIVRIYNENGFILLGTIDKYKLNEDEIYYLPNHDNDEKIAILEIEDE